MNFANVKELKINNKNVKSIDINGKRAWSALKTFTITYNLNGATSSNTATTILEGSSYSTTISTGARWLNGMTVLMNGVNISSSVASVIGSNRGTINIPSVTGNLVITAIVQ
jgi:hypothetical protein